MLYILLQDQRQCRQGTAHLKMLICGSRSFAIAQRISMLVSKIEISPSIFMSCARITPNISLSTTMPCREAKEVWCTRRNMVQRSERQAAWSVSARRRPLYIEMRCIQRAHSLEFPWMISARKDWKESFFQGLSRIAIPTSMSTTSTFALYFCTRECTSFSYSQFSSANVCSKSVCMPSFIAAARTRLRTAALVAAKKLTSELGESLMRTRMFPAWQSACTKLCFMSIEKKAFAPMLAITLFRGWLCVQQQPMVRPSMNYSMSTQSVDSGKARGNDTFESISILPKRSILRFSCRKHSCSARIFFKESTVTGISNFLENFEKKRLKANSKSMSFSRFFAANGCLTFTATSLPCNRALYTCETDPEAIGSRSKCSKSSSMLFPYIRFIVSSVLLS